MDKPKACKDEHLDLLNQQRLLGKNMMQGVAYLTEAYPKMKPEDAQSIWRYWFNTLNDKMRTA